MGEGGPLPTPPLICHIRPLLFMDLERGGICNHLPFKFAHHRLVQKAVLKNKTLLVLRSLNSFNYIIVKTLQVRKCIVIMLYIKYLSSYLKNNIYYGGLWRKNHGNRDTLLLILSGIPVSFVFGWALL